MNEMKLMNERNQYLIKFIEYKNIFFRIKVTKKKETKKESKKTIALKLMDIFVDTKWNEWRERTTEETG